VLWAIVLYVAATWTYGVLVYMRRPAGVSYGSIFQAAFAWILAVLFFFTEWNKLHLLWLAPLAWIGSLLLQGSSRAIDRHS